jgi:hypothetical protein
MELLTRPWPSATRPLSKDSALATLEVACPVTLHDHQPFMFTYVSAAIGRWSTLLSGRGNPVLSALRVPVLERLTRWLGRQIRDI